MSSEVQVSSASFEKTANCHLFFSSSSSYFSSPSFCNGFQALSSSALLRVRERLRKRYSDTQVHAMEFDLENPLTSSQDLHSHAVASLFQAENHHMPSIDYCGSLDSVDCDVSFRRQAISSILQVSGISFKDLDCLVVFDTDLDCGFQMSSSFDPFLSYLAINYLDRFLSRSEMPVKMRIFYRFLFCSCARKCLGTVFSLHVRLLRQCFFGFPALKRMQYFCLKRKKSTLVDPYPAMVWIVTRSNRF